jgi:hypothetical protein
MYLIFLPNKECWLTPLTFHVRHEISDVESESGPRRASHIILQ